MFSEVFYYMSFAPIPEYEGKSPYVFISYAQQDERIAYAIVVKMFNEGFRLWSSAACGNPSSMRIAERLSNSAVAMVFLSRNYQQYIASKEFEPRAVINSPKQKIVICLDDTPLGAGWNTVDFPAGIRYNPDVPQGLWLRINSSDTLEKCRGAWPKRPMPVPYDEKPQMDMSSVGEDELTDEMYQLNSVMNSFGAGLDDDEINSISLFRKDDPVQDEFRWPQNSEPSQEQEYYSIENLIDNSPVPISPEKKQYDSMIGLIESFMEKSSRAKEEEQKQARILADDEMSPRSMPVSENTYSEYHAVPKNEFESVDLSKDSAAAPVVITGSSEPLPVTLDYGEETEIAAYSMTRSQGRADRVSGIMFYSSTKQPEPQPEYNEVEENEKEAEPKKEKMPEKPSEPVFEKIVDDRKFIKSTDDNIDDAKLTYPSRSLPSRSLPSRSLPSRSLPSPNPPSPNRLSVSGMRKYRFPRSVLKSQNVLSRFLTRRKRCPSPCRRLRHPRNARFPSPAEDILCRSERESGISSTTTRCTRSTADGFRGIFTTDSCRAPNTPIYGESAGLPFIRSRRFLRSDLLPV